MTATAIGTLRLTGAAADTPALRLRAARELAGADLSPPGLPPAAVLVVRRLADPLPRRLLGGEPRSRPEPAWERAVRERLADAARSAARADGRGALPGAAAAVLFADPAEALACAVRERLRGRLDGCWWWRSVRRRLELPGIDLHGRSGGRDPAPLLAARPREAPAVLACLDRWGETPAVASALSAAGAARVLAALAAVHGLPRELVTPAGPAAVVRRDREERGRGAADEREREDGGAVVWRAAGAPPPEPWARWLPEIPSGTAPEVRCLLGVALALAAAPHRLRSAEAARQGRRWWRSVREESPARPGTGPPPPTGAGDRSPEGAASGEPSSSAAVTAEPGRSEVADGPAAPAVPSGRAADRDVRAEGASEPLGEADLASRRSDDPPDRAAGSGPAAHSREAPPPGPERRPAGDRGARGAGEDGGRPDPRPAPPGSAGARDPVFVTDPAEVEKHAARALPGRAVGTRLGGVLYLVHALVDLGLPGAFERGWRLASDAGPWGTLDLVARGLLGRRFAGVADDPLWRVLAGLAAWGDEPARPVRRGRKLSAYRVPAGWPAKLGDRLDRAFWSAAQERLRVWSAAGYLVADVPRSAAPPSVQARRELARVAGADGAAKSIPRRKPTAAAPLAVPPPLPAGCPARLGAWLPAALPAIRRRLLLALVGSGDARGRALATPPGDRRDPVARTLLVPGRLHVTSSHVDLVLPIAAADLTVRRAGLDRDPGWLPGFGRVVCFHFEQELGARP